jgi:steroid 5-alpha reductase family enzyme
VKKQTLQSIIAIVATLVVAALVAVAGSQGSVSVGGLPLFALCVAAAFVVQWIAFVPAYVRQTEHFFDLTGSLTYLALTAGALTLSGIRDHRAFLIGALVAVWAVRLGVFLFTRVRAAGLDRRFTAIKPLFARFLMTWTLQGLWVVLTLGAGLAVMTSTRREPLGWPAAAGFLCWLAGFSIEVVADQQKRSFRRDSGNEARFIRRGLWAWSRHPNYFGEILLWVGITVIAAPALFGWQRLTLVSPLFVYLLLTRISGVPMLEARADRRWGDDPEYQAYRSSTPALMLRPPRRG